MCAAMSKLSSQTPISDVWKYWPALAEHSYANKTKWYANKGRKMSGTYLHMIIEGNITTVNINKCINLF